MTEDYTKANRDAVEEHYKRVYAAAKSDRARRWRLTHAYRAALAELDGCEQVMQRLHTRPA
jgi:hypothetical protein